MVEYSLSLDSIFGALSDPTRRAILQQVSSNELSVGQIAKHYDLTFAAVSKHLKVLERAKLIIKRRRGKQQMVHLAPQSLEPAAQFIEIYRAMWESRFDALEQYLNETKEN